MSRDTSKLRALPQCDVYSPLRLPFLMSSYASPYYMFDKERDDFLKSETLPSERQRRRRLHFIGREEVECSLRGHLFWRMDQTFARKRRISSEVYCADSGAAVRTSLCAQH